MRVLGLPPGGYGDPVSVGDRHLHAQTGENDFHDSRRQSRLPRILRQLSVRPLRHRLLHIRPPRQGPGGQVAQGGLLLPAAVVARR